MRRLIRITAKSDIAETEIAVRRIDDAALRRVARTAWKRLRSERIVLVYISSFGHVSEIAAVRNGKLDRSTAAQLATRSYLFDVSRFADLFARCQFA